MAVTIQLPVNQVSKTAATANNNVEILLSHEKIEEYLKDYPASNLLYDEWLEVGFALHHNYMGSKQGYDIWQAWSSQDPRCEDDINEKKWKSFGAGKNPLTFLTVIKRIKEKRRELKLNGY